MSAQASGPSVISPTVLLLALCAVLAIWAASSGGSPVLLVPPPITRRTSKYFAVPHTQQCTDGVQEGQWTDWPLTSSCTDQLYASCGESIERRWAFSQRAAECGARRHSRADIQRLLGGKWVVFAGDSITRMLYAALLRAAGSKGQEILLKHQDFEYTFGGNIRATFLWRAFPNNVTDLYNGWKTEHKNSTAPDLVLSSVSLWHLLYMADAELFGRQLGELRAAAQGYLDAMPAQRRPHLLLGDTTETFTNRQPTEQKRKNMTPQNVDKYNQAVAAQAIVGPGAPFTLLDMFELTRGCGEECSTDGIHSYDFVYDTALQHILNIWKQWSTELKAAEEARP